MNVKTRGNSSSDRKRKVFFAACTGDTEKYFNVVADMILKHQNCAVYCNAQGEAPDTEELKMMNLIVIAVTGNFVRNKKNSAYEVVFKCAKENAIPVLPIIMEQLDKTEEGELNEMLGNLHFLNYTSTDKTELLFDDKLSGFLKSILISDELAERVRSAFDAYIFLSYRKKDRAYANELMKLIHSNEFARDIAIWFDEFLTPGEDFNDSIKAALEKSDLFVLDVTPNLIDDDDAEKMNFVREHEYPMAVERNKRIFPVEMKETDKKRLGEQYKDIPVCAVPDNKQAFSHMLLNSLSGIAKSDNDNDPQHKFFIGLAYLGGIDVEKNAELAERLITESADAGLPEAMSKLANMHRYGDGVEKNMAEAAIWQKKYIRCLYQHYQEEKKLLGCACCT